MSNKSKFVVRGSPEFWRLWRLEGLKAMPLFMAAFATLYLYGWKAGAIAFVFAMYIAGLGDKEWQRRMKL